MITVNIRLSIPEPNGVLNVAAAMIENLPYDQLKVMGAVVHAIIVEEEDA